MVTVIIASKSPIKIAAVEKVREEYGLQLQWYLQSIDPDQKIEQPFGSDAGYEACLARMHNANLKYKPDGNCYYVIGIESYVFGRGGKLHDEALVIMRQYSRQRIDDKRSKWTKVDRELTTCSLPLPLPTDCTLKPGETCGDLLVDMGIIINAKDPHSSIIGVKREVFIYEALEKLIKFFNINKNK